MRKPLCIELFCGMFGWSAGWLEMGGRAVGFDIEHCDYHGPVPEGASLVLQDVLTLHGSQFKDADLILASPPCQAYSYRAMPWKRAKALPPPDNSLFEACFRIQREASEAAGRHIPMVIENVRGARPWVGNAAGKFGSYYLWGDVPALMPVPEKAVKVDGFNFHQHEKTGKPGGSFQSAAVAGTKHKAHNVDAEGWFGKYKPGNDPMRNTPSKSPARRAASAAIAKIPLELSRHIARVYFPLTTSPGSY